MLTVAAKTLLELTNCKETNFNQINQIILIKIVFFNKIYTPEYYTFLSFICHRTADFKEALHW